MERIYKAYDETGKEYVFEVNRQGGSLFLTLKKELFEGAKQLRALRDLSETKAGQDGYYLIPRNIGMMGDMQIMFTKRADETYLHDRPIMSMYALKLENYCALIRIERNYKYAFEISVKDGCYSVCVCFDFEDVKKDPVYDDIRIEIVELPLSAKLGDFARTERGIRLERGELRTLREKCEEPAVEYARKYPLIRIRLGWKPSPSPVLHQNLENEPDMFVACSFERVRSIADELKRQGVEGAELQLVGWNRSGHDGRFPQLFPADPRLGGNEGLKKTIEHVKNLGYRISLHTNLIDSYEIANTFTWDDVCVKKDGEYDQTGHFGGGYSYHVCPKRQLKNNRRDLPDVAKLGTNGVHFTDVISIVEPDSCHAKEHVSYTKDSIEAVQTIVRESRELMGAFSSEGTMDFTLKYLDYGLYISFGDGFGKKYIPFGERCIPFFELTYHGILLYNPISPTVNYPIKTARDKLIYLLRGGRPTFYIYSKFRTGGKANWMGEIDLTTETDEAMRETAGFIADSAREYLSRADKQLVYMENYEIYENGVEVVTYEDGSRVAGNFSERPAVYDGHTIPAGEALIL
ncbi:MAG: hypothetical protein IJ428_04315 [Clostridia bacterium]|nr:hypothetical protein [Clostridia bacterium]